MSVHRGRKVTDAVIAALDAAGLTVGDGQKPDSAGWNAARTRFEPYVVVHGLPGGTTDGPLDDADADAEPLYQITAHGASRAQAEWCADEARTVMLAAAFTISGRTVAQVSIDMLGGCRRVDDLQPPQWQAVDRYRVLTVP